MHNTQNLRCTTVIFDNQKHSKSYDSVFLFFTTRFYYFLNRFCSISQDFEALTPNLMARTIETVEGGGLIIFLLKTMDSLRQLHSITMDVHSR